MELAEVTRMADADEQCAHAEGKDVGCGPGIKSTDLRHEQIPDYGVEKSPNNVDR
jgi:trans-aconitate methyltransferase